MAFSITDQSIDQIIQQRYSCRKYQKLPLSTQVAENLEAILSSVRTGCFGTPLRFLLAASTETSQAELRGLGTYGFINNPAGFIIGAAQTGEKDLEDFGYALENILLHATRLGLGTCWLGGSFTRGSFAEKISLRADEVMPVVAALGIPVAEPRKMDLVRINAGSDHRLSWDRLFFEGDFRTPLTPDHAAGYAQPLEMVRLGPSASNKQPWRVVKDGAGFHFFIQRRPGNGKGFAGIRFPKLADLQRVDLGIALCHFELSARYHGLAGEWIQRLPENPLPEGGLEYVATWAAQG